MAIKVRTLREDGEIEISYPSVGGMVPQKDIKKADALDLKIKEKICNIEENARKKSLLQLKGKKNDVVKLYHFVGTELKPFIESLKLNNDDKQYIWGEINFHANKLKMDGTTRLDRDRGNRNAWKNSVKLADWPEKDAFELDWGNWVELFDTKLSKNDPRIINWIISTKRKNYDKKKDGSLQTWFRILRKAISMRISKEAKIDTTYLNDDELNAELNAALDTIESDFKSNIDKVVKRKKDPKEKIVAKRKLRITQKKREKL